MTICKFAKQVELEFLHGASVMLAFPRTLQGPRFERSKQRGTGNQRFQLEDEPSFRQSHFAMQVHLDAGSMSLCVALLAPTDQEISKVITFDMKVTRFVFVEL